jgi:predicted PurR-regulated permease PerM
MSNEPSPPSVRPSTLPNEKGAAASAPAAETRISAFPGEAPIPPGSSARTSLVEPARLSVTMLDPDALAPLFFAGLFAATWIGVAYVFSSFISDFVLAFILVGLAHKPYEHLRRVLKGRSVLASLVSTLAIAFGFVGPLGTLVYIIGLDATKAMSRLPGLLAGGGDEIIEETLLRLKEFGVDLPKELVLDWLSNTVGSLRQIFVKLGGAILSNTVSGAVHLLIVLVMVFYILMDGHKLKSFLFDLSPLPDDEDAALVDTFVKVSRGVVIGNGLGSLIQGVLGGVAMAVVGLPSPVLWGGMMTLFAFLPLIGISAVSIPATIHLYLLGQKGAALAFFLFCSAQAFVVDNIVKTKLMGSAMRMHDLMVFLSILGGLAAFGVVGLIYGPLIAMMFMTLSEMYQKRYRPRFVAQLGMRRP